jgi:hypothetical protein
LAYHHFLFFLLIPYVAVQDDYQKFNKQNMKEEGTIFPLLVSVDASLKSQKGYRELIREISHNPQDFRNIVQNATSGRLRSEDCEHEGYNGDFLIQCRINSQTDLTFSNDTYTAYAKVLNPLISIYNSTQVRYLYESVLNRPIKISYNQSSITSPKFQKKLSIGSS